MVLPEVVLVVPAQCIGRHPCSRGCSHILHATSDKMLFSINLLFKMVYHRETAAVLEQASRHRPLPHALGACQLCTPSGSQSHKTVMSMLSAQVGSAMLVRYASTARSATSCCSKQGRLISGQSPGCLQAGTMLQCHKGTFAQFCAGSLLH